MDPRTLRLQVDEISLRAEQMKAEEYRKLLISLVDELEGTSASTSARRELAVDVPAVARTASPARANRPAPYRRAESVRRGVVRGGGARVSASPSPATPRPTDWRLTRSQALNSPNDGLGASRASTISTGSTHENDSEAGDVAPYVPPGIHALLDGAGLAPYSLSWGENERANMTPRIPRATLFKIFGGYSKAEWFECDLRPNYRHFFCADFIAQPFAPTHVGNRGLVLLSPESTDASSQDEEGRIFHAFMSARAHSAPLHYLGDYTKIPPQDIAWSLLPKTCQYAWLKRLHTSGVTAARTVRVRIRLRDTLKREPSVVEVQRGLQNRVFDDKIRWKEILEALKSGEEKMRFVGIKCERYDAHLAAIISENRTK